MERKVNINISARHIHLNRETYDKLFDNELTVLKPLNQIGQFAANECVTVETPKGKFENVRIVGPLRSYNQFEVSKSDARVLGLNPPVRESGNLEGAEVVTIKTLKGEVTIPCCIIANRHVHMNPEEANEMGIKNGESLKLAIPTEKKGVIEVFAKVSDDGFFEVHLDTDDANAFLINKDQVGVLIK
jgi:propanediol utilization protein